MKTCNSCYIQKPETEFYFARSAKFKQDKKIWRKNNCKACTNQSDMQRVLTKKLNQGMPVVNCECCGLLMMKKLTTKKCNQCRGKND